jgi:hypothetical protein
MENQTEIWKDIIGFEGLYKISNLGMVKSLSRKTTFLRGSLSINKSISECVLKPSKDGYGYLFVNLFKQGVVSPSKIHRLISMAFIPNPENKPQVNHINGIKTDNRIENLEWVTAKENTIHSFATGLQKVPKGKFNHKSRPISQFTKEGVWVRDWDYLTEVKEIGFHYGNIGLVCRGKAPFAHGFIWKYKLL